MIRIDSSWSVLPQAPNIIVPRHKGLTSTPVCPSGRRSTRRTVTTGGILERVATRPISDERELRDIVGSPTPLVAGKITDRLNDLTRQFIERSPFVCVATGRPDGGLDVSPRGDPAGFVRVLDERTLLIPDRPGNRIA